MPSRIPRPRLTIRGLMIAVAVVAVGLIGCRVILSTMEGRLYREKARVHRAAAAHYRGLASNPAIPPATATEAKRAAVYSDEAADRYACHADRIWFQGSYSSR